MARIIGAYAQDKGTYVEVVYTYDDGTTETERTEKEVNNN